MHCRRRSCRCCRLALGIAAPPLHTEPLLLLLLGLLPLLPLLVVVVELVLVALLVLLLVVLPLQHLPLLLPDRLVVVAGGSALTACRCKASLGLSPHQLSRRRRGLLLLLLPAVAEVLLRRLWCLPLLLRRLPEPARSSSSRRRGSRSPCGAGHALPPLQQCCWVGAPAFACRLLHLCRAARVG